MDEKRRQLLAVLAPVIAEARGSAWGDALEKRLNEIYPADGSCFTELERLCEEGIAEGWMCLKGEGPRLGGRVIEPAEETGRLSVDVVQLVDFTGPHHRHPHGEICAVMPESDAGRFDGRPRGWAVYPPGSDHWPAATGGRVRILFLLPEGAIAYSDAAASLESGADGKEVA